MLSDGLYRKYRRFIPLVDDWCWTLTPWTCNPSDSYYVRNVYSSGAMYWNRACHGLRGARPLCYLESSIFVSVPYEEECADPNDEAVTEAHDAIMYVLEEYPADVWGDAIAAVVASLFRHNREAEDTAKEEAATRALNNTPSDQDGTNNAAAEG